MKRIYKYGTGQEVPKGSIFLSTIVEEMNKFPIGGGDRPSINRLVWHYFLVEVTE